MPLYKSRAIVIKSVNLGETDKIVTFLTQKYGKISGVAKGSRKITSRLLGNLETFNYTQLLFFGKENQNLYRINSSDIITSFYKIKNDLEKISVAMCIIELIDTMAGESNASRSLFELLVSFLSILQTSVAPHTVLRIFEIRLLSLLGYMPQLTQCTNCNTPALDNKTIGFDFRKKGIVCHHCIRESNSFIVITQGTKKFILKSLEIGSSNIERLKIPKGLEQEIKKFTFYYISSHTIRPLRSYKFISQIFSGR